MRRGPRARLVGVVNRPGETDDHVVVQGTARVRRTLRDPAGKEMVGDLERDDRIKATATEVEYWTLGRRAGTWILVSVEADKEGAYHLADRLIGVPSEDDGLHDLAATEQAVAAAGPAGVAELASCEFAHDARLAALDLAGLDGRYDPDVLEAAARRAVAAWAEAVDGDRRPLVACSSRATAEWMLHPGGTRRTRLVLRGPRLRRIRIARLDPSACPPVMTIEVTISARRYLQSRRTGAVLAGSARHDATFTERWKLALGDDPAVPWRIVGRDAPRLSWSARMRWRWDRSTWRGLFGGLIESPPDQ